MMDVYNSRKNKFLREAKNLVPRIIAFSGEVAFCLVDKTVKNNYPYYYCFLTRYGIIDRDRMSKGDEVLKLSLTDYFNMSQRLLGLKLKINLKEIIYDSNRNK
jgi:hypothetical protein